ARHSAPLPSARCVASDAARRNPCRRRRPTAIRRRFEVPAGSWRPFSCAGAQGGGAGGTLHIGERGGECGGELLLVGIRRELVGCSAVRRGRNLDRDGSAQDI